MHDVELCPNLRTAQDEHARSLTPQSWLLLELQPPLDFLNLLFVHGQGFHTVWHMLGEPATLIVCREQTLWLSVPLFKLLG